MARLRLPDALPALTGRYATIYVAFWLVLLGMAVAGPVGSTIVRAQQPMDALLSLGLNWNGDDRMATVTLPFGEEARAKGVRSGEQVIAINGVLLADRGGAGALGARLEGHRAKVRLRRSDGSEHVVALTYRRANLDRFFAGTGLTAQREQLLASVPFLLAAAFMVLAAVLLFWRRRDPVAALLSLGILALTATSGIAYTFWSAIGVDTLAAVVLAPGRIAFLLGLLTFPNGRFEPRVVWGLVPIIILPQLGALVPGPTAETWALYAFMTSAAGIMAVLIWRYVRDRRNDGARQWRWALLGLVTGVSTAGLFFTVLQPKVLELAGSSRIVAAWQSIIISSIYALVMTSMFAGLVLSVLRYRLYDTQAAVSRSVLYGVLTIALLAIFTGSEKIIEALGEEYLGESMGALAGGLGAAFAAVAIGPLHHRVSHWVQHRFRKNLIQLGRDLPPLLAELGETARPEDVAHAALAQISHQMHATRGAVIERGEILARHGGEEADTTAGGPGPVGDVEVRRDADLPVQLRLSADGSSWLLLGARPDGSIFDAQERDLLSDLARPLAQALHLSSNRAADAAKLDARFDQLERAVAALQAIVAGREATPAVAS